MLVNNAGVGSVASILQADVEKMDDLIRVNITALTRLTYAVAPASSRADRARSSISLQSLESRSRI
jgi:short-subunit dehydrogenase